MSIRKIKSIRRYLCENSTKMLVNSTVLSRLDYCNSAYVIMPQKSLHRLQLAQNLAARIINLTPRHHHITPVLQRLNWLTVSKRCQLKIIMLTFKVLHRQVPPCIYELFPVRYRNTVKRNYFHRRQTITIDSFFEKKKTTKN